ncbi:hypothetical protein [Corallococcus exercitus]|uniref:hypothetical protein n=1 Tax=Corallococcus exercitus TaxID=2316736 RepID=UPI0035D44D9F
MPELTQPYDSEERADHVKDTELLDLTADSSFYQEIRAKLIGRGAKLLSGPRGTGKTHQMRFVYLECARNSNRPAAVYVSFSRYARLEPLLRTAPDALKVFTSWVIAKIVLGVMAFGIECESDLGAAIAGEIGISPSEVEAYVAEIENGDRLLSHDVAQRSLNVARLHELLRVACSICGRSRMVLLLDDAALSLTPEYHIEFFNVFQDLKSSTVAPKASVYPGTTQYGPRFHARHDAEYVNAWLSVEEPEYVNVMSELLSKRAATQDVPAEIVELFQYLSFGVPRVLLTMLRGYRIGAGRKRTVQQNVNSVVEEQVRLQRAEYESLAFKLPQFKSVINAGLHLFDNISNQIIRENQSLSDEAEKQTVIGIQRGRHSATHERMISLLVEVGLLYPLQPVQHGEGREYDRYIPHYARLMDGRAFAQGRGFSAKDTVAFIKRKSVKHPVRRTLESLLSKEDINVGLDLAPCSSCKTPRIDEAQRFCHHCGRPLPEPSRFRQMLELPLSTLPIPSWYMKEIQEATGIKTVGDLLSLQDPASELRKAWMIGKKRSAEILDAATTLVEEFLS